MEKLNFSGIKKFMKVAAPIAVLGFSAENNIKAQTEDFNLKNQQDKEIKAEENKPIFTNDRNDPRLIEYKDSLALYNQSELANDYLRKRGFVEKEEDPNWVSTIIHAPSFSDFHNYLHSKPAPYGGKTTFRVVPSKNNDTYSVGYNAKIKPVGVLTFCNLALWKRFEAIGDIKDTTKFFQERKKLANELGIEEDCLSCGLRNIVPQYQMPKQKVVYVPNGFTTDAPFYSGIKIIHDHTGKPLFYKNEIGEKIPYNLNDPSPKFTKEFAYPNYYKQMKHNKQKKP